jgi:phage terminase large subunit-like protein
MCPPLEKSVIGLDPGISVKDGVDGTGLVIAGQSPRGGDFYVFRDRSGVLTPEQYASHIVEEYQKGVPVGLTGAIIETNRGGDTIASVVRAKAQNAGIEVRMLGKKDEFPRRTPGVLYIKEVHNRGNKASRGVGPAALYKQGRVHHVGTFPELENEQCTYVPEVGSESPNRFDACNMALTELAGLNSDRRLPAAAQAQARQEATFQEELKRRLAGIRSRSVI